jgi:CheY-like chemotaxis protein
MGKKILVIDDEEDIIAVLKHRLSENGYEVTTAVNGQDGLDKMQKSPADLIILDVLMPVMDGFQFFKIIKNDPKMAHIPIIVLTARGGMRGSFEALDADEFVPKPYEMDDLLAKINGLFKGKALILGKDTAMLDKVTVAFQKIGYVTEIVPDEIAMFTKVAESKYKFIVAHLSSISKPPKEFMMKVRSLRNLHPGVIIYSDKGAKKVEEGGIVAFKELSGEWESAGVNLFFDPTVAEASFTNELKKLLS